MERITKIQAQRYLLLWQGLMGKHRFIGKEGAFQFVRQAGCVQFDPIDICGRSADLTLLSRVKGYEKNMLEALLYEERRLADYFDKNLAIIPAEDWPCFARERAWHESHGRSREQADQLAPEILSIIREKGPQCAQSLPFSQKAHWYWSDTSLSRAVLESLYFRGRLIIHHKKGTIKYYDLAERHLPEGLLSAPDPFPDAESHRRFLALRRIGAVGLMWNKASDAWLGIPDFKAAERNAAFAAWEKEGEIIPVQVEGIREILYMPKAGLPDLERACSEEKFAPRCEVIAPLDSLMWDRKLIRALFDFEYKWEIYTPASQRKYGYYVLPLLRNGRLIGRVEAVREEKALRIRNLWLEEGEKISAAGKRDIEKCLQKLAGMNDLTAIKMD